MPRRNADRLGESKLSESRLQTATKIGNRPPDFFVVQCSKTFNPSRSAMQDQFWYPQLKGDSSDSEVVTSALNQFVSLFDGERNDFKKPPLSSAGPGNLFNLGSLLETLSEESTESIIVLGTCSKERAVEHSWDQLGLNLFDLPWFESEKAFRYVNATSLFEDVGALKLLLGERSVEADLEKAKEQLERAQCHRFAQAVQNFVGHGERDHFQYESAGNVVNEFGTRYDDWKKVENWKKVEHIDKNCQTCKLLNERVEHLRKKPHDEEIKRNIADLDSHLYKLAPVLHFGEGQSGDEKDGMWREPRFRCVVLLEDNPKVRGELRKKLREFFLPAADGSSCNGDTTKWCTSDSLPITEGSPLGHHLYEKGGNLLYVVEADKERSTERHRLVGKEGGKILNNLLENGITIIREVRQKLDGAPVHYRTIDKNEGGETEKARDENWDKWKKPGKAKFTLQRLAKQEATLRPSEILTCFDLDLKTGTGELSDTLHRGLWVMYGTACSYPQIPRMVITGYRSQTAMGHGAGAHAYLMKPFTTEKLGAAISKAQSVRRVTWICPKDVRDDYNELGSHLSEGCSSFFDRMKNLLCSHLRQQRVSLTCPIDPIKKTEASKLAGSDLIVLDPFQIKGEKDEFLARYYQMIKEVRSADPDVPLLLLLPTDSDSLLLSGKERKWSPEEVVENYLRGSPLRLREGKDAIGRKPTWIAADGHSDSEAGLANQIHSLLSAQDEFDVKYQVLVPVGAVLGRCGEHVHDIRSRMHEESVKLDDVFAPLLPLLVQAYGLSASLRDLRTIKSVRLAHDLRLQIRRDQKQNDWGETEAETVNDVLTYFAETAISSSAIQRHMTVENWMRRMVDREAMRVYEEEVNGAEAGDREEDHSGFEDISPLTDLLTRLFDWVRRMVREAMRVYEEEVNGAEASDGEEDHSGFEDISPLTRPLSRLFGGSTRYEFTARGSWYDEKNKRVDDLLIVVEFAARSSIVARHVVEDLAVHYLSEVAGEDKVMVQEISTNAHFWSDS